ncbi:MAG: hypothetical protein DWQ02_28225 [Bacteroidetes bacterium]|nr:MAG: hypothetical protein DWQ02_28225 [Bacteroidota bacterium]
MSHIRFLDSLTSKLFRNELTDFNKMHPKFFINGLLVLLFIGSFPFKGLSQFDLSIKAGMNMGDIKVRSENLLVDEQYAPLRLWHVGISGTTEFSEKFGGQIGLLVNQKGGQSPLDLSMPNPLEAYWQYKITYLTLPMLLQYKAGPLSFEAGPEVSCLIGLKTLRNDVKVSNDLSFLGKYPYEIAASIGFKFTVERFFTELKWTRGLNTMGQVVFYDMDGVKLGHYDHFSHTIQVSFGFYFYKRNKD